LFVKVIFIKKYIERVFYGLKFIFNIIILEKFLKNKNIKFIKNYFKIQKLITKKNNYNFKI